MVLLVNKSIIESLVTSLTNTFCFRKSFSELYSVEKAIGVGGGGVVYAGVRNEDKRPVAVKLVPRDKVKRWEKIKHRTVPQEIALMMR